MTFLIIVIIKLRFIVLSLKLIILGSIPKLFKLLNESKLYVVNSIALKTIKTMMNNFTIYKHIKLGILSLSFSIDQVTHLVYEDLYPQQPNIRFIKIYIMFYDQNNALIEKLYFFSKDNI